MVAYRHREERRLEDERGSTAPSGGVVALVHEGARLGEAVATPVDLCDVGHDVLFTEELGALGSLEEVLTGPIDGCARRGGLRRARGARGRERDVCGVVLALRLAAANGDRGER